MTKRNNEKKRNSVIGMTRYMRSKTAFMFFAGMACAGALLYASKAEAQQCVPPRVLIVLDKSSSMNYPSGDGVTPKWTVAQQAIEQVTGSYEGSIEFGLMVFPYPDQCSPGMVTVDTGLQNSGAITAALGDAPPEGGNYTPMYQSLDEAATYAPLLDPGQPNYVLLVTDGWQWCYPHDPSTRFLPIESVQGLADVDVTTFVVGFGDGVDTLTLNGMSVAGGTSFNGCDENSSDPLNPNNCYYQADDTATLTAALQQIAVQVSQETCDGLDNDCDGLVDEDITRACDSICGPGEEVCVNGAWQGCTAQQPETEACDDIDNDCDGVIDEGCSCLDGDTRPCGTDMGECEMGTQICVDGAWSECEGAIDPAQELCDGLDNDCDEEVDEGCDCIDGDTRPCGDDIGQCEQGTQSCVDGEWSECVGASYSEPESCDGLDNDCDGLVDEDENMCGLDAECVDGTCVPFEEQQPGASADAPSACGCRLHASSDRPEGPAALLLLIIGLSLVAVRRRRRS
jgi:hypothetical protein